MVNNIKYRPVNKYDAYNYYRFKNKAWRDAYIEIFPSEVFDEKERRIIDKVKNFEERIINNTECIAYVAELNNEIIGLMYGRINSADNYFSSEYADLVSLYIDPDFQNQGIGGKLKDIFNDWAKKNGSTKFVIGVLKDNIKARKVYEKWGGELANYEKNIYELGKKYKEVFYTYNIE